MVAAFATTAPVIVLAVTGVRDRPLVLPSGEIEDSSQRGAALLLSALPWLYVVAVLLFLTVGYVLLRFGVRKLSHFIAISAAPSLLLAAYLALWMSYHHPSGSRGVLLVFVIVGAAAFACITLGTLTWWWFAVKPRSMPQTI